MPAQVDVSSRGAVDDALAKVRADFGRVEIMVTRAGIDATTPFTEITLDAWDRMMAVNAPPSGVPGPARTSPPRAASCAPTRPATSPGSPST